MRYAVCMICLVAGTVLSACGGSKPSSSTSPTPVTNPNPNPPAPTPVATTLTVVSGETDAPIAGARVVVGTQTVETDGNGNATVNVLPTVKVDVEISAPGHLDRQTSSANGWRYTVWPKNGPDSFNEATTSELVYHASLSLAQSGGSFPMIRVVTPNVTVALSPELLADAQTKSVHERAARELTDLTGGRVKFDIGSCGSGVCVTTGIKPLPGANAMTTWTVGNSSLDIRGAHIDYSEINTARTLRTVMHEFGHVLGMKHLTTGTVLMCGTVQETSTTNSSLSCIPNPSMTNRERLILRLMYQRPTKNTYPDNDRAAGGIMSMSSGRTTTIAIVD